MSRIAFAALALGLAAAWPVAGQQPTRRPAAARRPARAAAASRSQAPATVSIPYQRFTLKNGLTLLVHEDHKAPIVAVNIWYHVGSKNEKPGRTGFAHLFEHLMFNGSEHFNDDYFQPFERIGATDQNGTTNEDRTNYFENVPTNALDVALWMESDRMGHLLGVIDTARVNEQRGVVQNEKRQGENQPYGKVDGLMTAGTYPAGHPYSWEVVGSMEDLNAASVEDVKDWFRTYYGPNNAVMVLAGDITPDVARQKVEQYFGDIPATPPIAKQSTWIARRTGTHREIMQDRVPQPRIYKEWNVPEFGSADGDYLDLVTDVLSAGKTSRLYKRLVYDEQIATDVAAYVDLREIGGQLVIRATAKPGGDLARVERSIDDELARFIRTGPTPSELRRVKTQNRANFVRGVERIGGFGGKSDVLAHYETFTGNADNYLVTRRRIDAATTADLKSAAARWLSDGAWVLEVHPYPEFGTVAGGADRSKLPAVGAPPDARFPAIARATLPNGLKIVLAERHSIPQVNMTLLLDAGYAADQSASPGTARLAMDMLDEGTTRRTALQISDTLSQLGAQLFTSSLLDVSRVGLSAMKDKLDPSLDIFADVVLNPSFPQADFQRLQRQTLARIQREKAQPVQMALRVFPQLLYGSNHAYGNPLTGSGTEASVQHMTRDDLVRFHRTWFKPNHATLVIVGDVSLAEIQPKLTRLFSRWQAGDVPQKNVGTVADQPKPLVYILDRPGAEQSIILAADLAPPKANPHEYAVEAMTSLLGGQFTSRVNMNLREDKHWSYGAFTFVWDARGQRPFIAYAPVQTDKTKESMIEVDKELRGILGPRPITADELSKAQANLTLSLPGTWETMDAVLGSLEQMVTYGLDDHYFETYADRVRAQTIPDATTAAQEAIRPDHLVWVVVGDRAKIEAGIRELNFGEVRFLDADGKPLASR
ncbi:MAG TPA: pitrilysin family protein [Gemmatimonadales bacterium]|jgi:zinc protease|nr:pitrilysin family protein [Gemmatimonadales bacterium]